MKEETGEAKKKKNVSLNIKTENSLQDATSSQASCLKLHSEHRSFLSSPQMKVHVACTQIQPGHITRSSMHMIVQPQEMN